MNGKFVHGKDLEVQTFDWGTFRWVSGPSATGAAQLVVCQVEVFPGKGHNFHQHPGQEEVIHIIDGSLEQWLGKERCVLGAGDSVFIPRGLVHASFTLGDRPARCLAILGPCLGDSGYELVDVSAQAPWSTLRVPG